MSGTKSQEDMSLLGREFSGWKNRKELARVRFGQRKWSSIVEEEASTRGKVMGFSRQEYWNGLPFPPPGDLSAPGIEPMSLRSPALAGVNVAEIVEVG